MTAMPYITLSEQVGRLSNPQRSDAFVRRLREAVRTGELEAAQVPGRFTLPNPAQDLPQARQRRDRHPGHPRDGH
ncbi:hypothetical protein HNQ09_002117 [Deinococcus budaensis]|uniref:Uncharacterized protein n=1 Tax=Deinococcus budaensis TaxID=1665626 RepID=A0A7W8GG24_9DEIO|nr:hypothetical protein [Deinococcus budaensis]